MFIDYTMRRRKPKPLWYTTQLAPKSIDTDTMLEMDKEWRIKHHIDRDLLKVWVVYQWSGKQWLLSGFRRRRRRRKGQSFNRFFAKVRRRLMIDKNVPIMLMDLATAQVFSKQADQSWQYRAPSRNAPAQPRHEPARAAVALPAIPTPRQARRRAPRRALRYNRREHSYIALGRLRYGDREAGYMYLGPMVGMDSLKAAEREAARLFGVVWDTRVLATSELSKRLRGRIHSGKKIVAGQTRLLWPEPLELDDMVTLERIDSLTADNYTYLVPQATKLVKRAVKHEDEKELVYALAVLLFVEAFAP